MRGRGEWRAPVAALPLAVALMTCASGGEPVRADLVLRVGPLPACEYGLAYERPLVVELRDQGGAVARGFTSGIDLGEESRFVTLFVHDAVAGNYELAFGRCPPLRDDPRASVACDPPAFFDTMIVRVNPSGRDAPRTVLPIHFRAPCVPRLGPEAGPPPRSR